MPRFWPNDGECIIGSIHIQTINDVEEQVVIFEVTKVLKSHIKGLEELTVQVEKVDGGFRGCGCNFSSHNHNFVICLDDNRFNKKIDENNFDNIDNGNIINSHDDRHNHNIVDIMKFGIDVVSNKRKNY